MRFNEGCSFFHLPFPQSNHLYRSNVLNAWLRGTVSSVPSLPHPSRSPVLCLFSLAAGLCGQVHSVTP